jgi:hypothetical protein
VILALDIVNEKDLALTPDMHSIIAGTDGIRNEAEISVSTFDPKQFNKEVKRYVADAQLAKCLFAAFECQRFQELQNNEPRLSIFIANENFRRILGTIEKDLKITKGKNWRRTLKCFLELSID